MERTQQNRFSIYEHHRQLLEENLELLLRFEQFLQQLPADEYPVRQQTLLAEQFAHTRNSIAYLEKCQQEAAEERQRMGFGHPRARQRKKAARARRQ